MSIPLGPSTPLVPPLYQSSVYTLPDLDALDRVLNGEETGYIYALGLMTTVTLLLYVYFRNKDWL